MSVVPNPRDLRAKIFRNQHGQIFIVCSKCEVEFVTMDGFLDHFNDLYECKDFRIQFDDLAAELIPDRTKTNCINGSQHQVISLCEKEDTVRDIKGKKNCSETSPIEDSSEAVRKVTATVSKSEPRRGVFVLSKPKKPTRKESCVPSLGKVTSSGGGRYSSSSKRGRTTVQHSSKLKCKMCGATFSTMIKLDSHEIGCTLLPM